MRPAFESIPNDLEIYKRNSGHFSPHSHSLLEFILCLTGSLDIGVGTSMWHMEKGDLAVIFPGIIHHGQVFSDTPASCTSLYLLAATTLTGSYVGELLHSEPACPVIRAADVHPDIRYALQSLYRTEGSHIYEGKHDFSGFISMADRRSPARLADAVLPKAAEDFTGSGAGVLAHTGETAAVGGPDLPQNGTPPLSPAARVTLRSSFVQIILTRALPCLTLTPRKTLESGDLIFRMVSYIAAHFREQVSLTSVADALHVSPYTLSRATSRTFHVTFPEYVNTIRLEYVCVKLRYTDQSITEAAVDAGFSSQRTFNRVFRELYRMSPREWRNASRTGN